MEARVGRVKQRYGDNGERLVAGVVAISVDKKKVLVVESTTRNNHWVLPKGGYETDEATPQDAAAREAWEEAGITGKVGVALQAIQDPRSTAEIEASKGKTPRSLYYFFEFEVENEAAQWPEMHKRKRRWMTYAEAKRCFEGMNRPELKQALEYSSIDKTSR